MRSVNKVILIGNLTRNPEMRDTQSGQKIVTFGLATNREWMTKDGRKMQSAEFHELVAWAKLGEICMQYLIKGKLIYVEGYLKTRVKELPDGTKKYRTEIVVQDMIMLEKRSKGEEAQDMEMLKDAPLSSDLEDDSDMPIGESADAPSLSAEKSASNLFEG